jgi:hypothetical protein
VFVILSEAKAQLAKLDQRKRSFASFRKTTHLDSLDFETIGRSRW